MHSHTWSCILVSFVIVTLFHGVTGRIEAVKCHPREQAALLKFKNGIIVDDGNILQSWREGEDCCRWRGITCNNITGYVVQVHLSNQYKYKSNRMFISRVSGKLDPALVELEHLQYLDLSRSNLGGGAQIPEFLGSFRKLRYLNLSESLNFSGEIPQTLGNLSKLEVLDFNDQSYIHANSLGWLSNLRALKYLNLNGVQLHKVGHEWMDVLSSFSSLEELHLTYCNLAGSTSKLPFLNSSSLRVIKLGYNHQLGPCLQHWLLNSNMSSLVVFAAPSTDMNGSIAAMFSKLPKLEELYLSENLISQNVSDLIFASDWSNIRVIELYENRLVGKLPASIGNFSVSLQILDLSSNLITGVIPTEIGHLQNLRELDLGNYLPGLELRWNFYNLGESYLSSMKIEGALPHSLCQLKKLVKLSLGYNALNGTIPDCLGFLTSLETLSLEHNHLAGNLPTTLGELSHLRTLLLGGNTLEGPVLDSHLHNLTKLEELDISSNLLKLQLSSNWIPPFQDLVFLYLDSCSVGPGYPPWLRMLKHLVVVDLSNASIEGFLPQWFCESRSLAYMDLSNNKIGGKLSSISNCTSELWRSWDLSSNYLHGPIPSLNATFKFLSLSFNQFRGQIPSRLMFSDISWNSLDLSHNQLTGEIPSNIGNWTGLEALDLSGNHLSGQVPVLLGRLQGLKSLHLGDNNLSGTLPWELKNCTFLETLDLGGNRFTGRIPKWIGESLWFLHLLRLRSNLFSMEIPQELMNLPFLHVLDVADNKLSGTIPRNIGNLTMIRTRQTKTEFTTYGGLSSFRIPSFEERLDVERNRIRYKYTRKILSLVTTLDLSSNNLSGEIPAELTDLAGLTVLNLAHNQFSGLIPERIGNLGNLDTLDLCENRLSGKIPLSLADIPRLGHLNLSHNNLSGHIPMSPQLQTLVDPSIYFGNNGLCGFPLQNNCEEKKTNASITTGSPSKSIHKGDEAVGIYVSVVAGFIMGFWCVLGPLLFKRSLRILYFRYIDHVTGSNQCW